MTRSQSNSTTPAGYYVEASAGRSLQVFGPFESKEAAEEASFLRRSQTEQAAYKGDTRGYASLGAGYYTEGEIACLLADPEGLKYSAVTLCPPDHCPIHPSWQKDLAFSRRYFRYATRRITSEQFYAGAVQS